MHEGLFELQLIFEKELPLFFIAWFFNKRSEYAFDFEANLAKLIHQEFLCHAVKKQEELVVIWKL